MMIKNGISGISVIDLHTLGGITNKTDIIRALAASNATPN
jgi:CBS domain-containing protein